VPPYLAASTFSYQPEQGQAKVKKTPTCAQARKRKETK
jgi:hypothetical protein